MRTAILIAAALWLAACGKKPAAAPRDCGGGLCCGDRPCRAVFGGCTQQVEGWCGGPNGDPCAQHADVGSCRADERCEGIGYTGESMVACASDARCFTSNCPTKGCISRCQVLDQAACEHSDGRCVWSGAACARKVACATDPSGRPL
jgi:hypothetical protein